MNVVRWLLLISIALSTFESLHGAEADDNAALAIFNRRIVPIMQAKNPSSCAECHLSGVDLKEYIRGDQAETFSAPARRRID